MYSENSIENLHKIFLEHPVVCTDTRNLIKGSLFFALKGDNFDANTFAGEAINKGCAYAVVDNFDEIHPNIIHVNNVLEALQLLAKFHRTYLGIPVIGITGSNGKTTTKELIKRVLQQRYNVFATIGNFNNHIGVPLSLLSLNKQHDIAVIEMGANHQGEINMLCTICLPNYGIITNIGKAHLEGFGGEEGVIKGKSELYKFIRKTGGLLFVFDEDELLMRLSHGIEKYTYGLTDKANFQSKILRENPEIEFSINDGIEDVKISSTLSGRYNFTNILAAVCIGNSFKVKPEDIKLAIEGYVSDNNRSQQIRTKKNLLFLDAYNANPSSMKAAIDNFKALNFSNKMVILGGMNELGDASKEEHSNLVKLILELNLEAIFLVGNHFQNMNQSLYIQNFENTDKLIDYLKEHEIANSTILIKGSRSNKLEQIVPYL